MKEQHVSFVSFPHDPHVNPTLPIVSALVRRGYRVTYATSEKFARRVAELGAEFVPAPAFRVNEVFEESIDEDVSQRPFCRLALRTLPEIQSFYERNKPDLIIYDFLAFAGRILAHRLKIPAIQTSPTFAHSQRGWENQVADPETRRLALEASSHADEFFRRHAVPSDGFLYHREKLNIYLFPKVLQPPGDVFGENCFYAGRCAAEQPYYGEWQKKDTDGRPIVLVATSTTYIRGPEFFRMCIEALSDLQWHIILSIGESGDRSALEPLPAHVEIVQHTSHVKILRYATLLICLGGIITTSEAAYHGLPIIVTSHGFPELEWQADNLERVGNGIHVRKATMDAAAVRRAAVHAMEAGHMADRVREIRRLVQREPGGEETANAIEEYLESYQR